MRFTITYNQLFAIEADIHRLGTEAPGVSFLLASKINLFYQRAAMDLKAMNMGITRIQKIYAEVDEQGELIKEGENGNIKFKDAATVGEKTYTGPEVEKAFVEELNVFLSRSIALDM